MFQRLGRLAGRFPAPVILVWTAILLLSFSSAPDWTAVSQEGEFAFLPEDAPSRRAERLYREAFPRPDENSDDENRVHLDPLGTLAVLVINREDRPAGLSDDDLQFVAEVLQPAVETVKVTTGAGDSRQHDREQFLAEVVRPVLRRLHDAREDDPESVPDVESLVQDVLSDTGAGSDPDAGLSPIRVLPPRDRIVSDVFTFEHPYVGPWLTSVDDKSTLIAVELKTEFLNRDNDLVLDRIEAVVEDLKERRSDYLPSQRIPASLEVSFSGPAAVGRDMLRAERQSTTNTELFTKVLVILLLLMIYRAPLLVIIPLVTVGLTVETTTCLLRHLAALGWISMFSGLKIYVTVVVYGAGVDFCLFLIARYKEELDRGATFQDAIEKAVSRVGIALATSAGTSIAGISMMMLADFGKFPQAGFAISFGLFIVLCCALTLTPALLYLSGRWAFWPDVRRERISPEEGWIPSTTGWSLLREQQWTKRLWEFVAATIRRRPGTVFAVTVLLMLPFTAVAVANYQKLSYGLLSELKPDEPSVVGAEAVQRHFSPGWTGSTTVLLQNDEFDFTSAAAGERFAAAVTEYLKQRKSELGIDDIRSQSDPLGVTRVNDAIETLPLSQRGPARVKAFKTYVSTTGPLAGDVIRIDLVLDVDPFTRGSITTLDRAEQAVQDALDEIQAGGSEDDLRRQRLSELAENTKVVVLGPTASIRDLKHVTDGDRITIAIAVTIAVYLVLVVLLGRPAVSAYLISTVVFSFLVTLGVTHVFFWALNPTGYTGIDWKAPIFLFTILVAIGEDYNILLVTRVAEEQRRFGPVEGVLQALTKTGGIISSCGIIMAGTFASLMTGTLMGIIQLGFALCFGVLLDTFVVRPILVPTYLVLLNQGRFGRLSRWLGAAQIEPARPGEESIGAAAADGEQPETKAVNVSDSSRRRD